ncbi:MAG: hypothetical protein QOH70_3114 [Blastocatellia bacterium]|nr:hypothetical protein [Blastocatellia bacterium]
MGLTIASAEVVLVDFDARNINSGLPSIKLEARSTKDGLPSFSFEPQSTQRGLSTISGEAQVFNHRVRSINFEPQSMNRGARSIKDVAERNKVGLLGTNLRSQLLKRRGSEPQPCSHSQGRPRMIEDATGSPVEATTFKMKTQNL